MFRNQQQRLHCGLPFFGIVFRLGVFRYVVRGIAQRHQGLSTGHQDRTEKPSIPCHQSNPATRTGAVPEVMQTVPGISDGACGGYGKIAAKDPTDVSPAEVAHCDLCH
jgi:hypothetical protein